MYVKHILFQQKEANLILSQGLITSPSRLLTIYLKTGHFIPQRGKKRLETIEKKRREIGGESEEERM